MSDPGSGAAYNSQFMLRKLFDSGILSQDARDIETKTHPVSVTTSFSRWLLSFFSSLLSKDKHFRESHVFAIISWSQAVKLTVRFSDNELFLLHLPLGENFKVRNAILEELKVIFRLDLKVFKIFIIVMKMYRIWNHHNTLKLLFVT